MGKLVRSFWQSVREIHLGFHSLIDFPQDNTLYDYEL
ncbi:hypothetical protein YN1HA_30620 [Sulfurisphaera ohwakuensis]